MSEAEYQNTDGLNMPSKPTGDGAAGGNGQRTRRYADTFYDLHRHPVRFPQGRPWTGERELAANPDLKHPDAFVSSDLQKGVFVADDFGNVDRRASFLSVWDAPFTPLPKYFKFNYKRKTISFDYAKMRFEESQAYDKYFEAAAKYGAQLNRQVEYGVVPHFQITAYLGEPTKLVQVAEAAMAGDPWLLGFSDEPNVELAKALGYSASGFKRTMSYTPLSASAPSAPVVTPEQVLATPNAELIRMVADMAAKAAMAAVEASFARRDADLAAQKASHSAKTKAGMARTKSTPQSTAPAGVNAA